jgi:TolB-like protein
VRITAQLIDATQDHHVWTERYDRPLKDQDQQAVKLIQAHFRLLSQNDAIRFALRLLALSPRHDEPAPLLTAKK